MRNKSRQPDDVDYEKWALALCGLLDEIEHALNNGKLEYAVKLVRKRLQIAADHGLEVTFTPVPSSFGDSPPPTGLHHYLLGSKYNQPSKDG